MPHKRYGHSSRLNLNVVNTNRYNIAYILYIVKDITWMSFCFLPMLPNDRAFFNCFLAHGVRFLSKRTVHIPMTNAARASSPTIVRVVSNGFIIKLLRYKFLPLKGTEFIPYSVIAGVGLKPLKSK